jgi:hypothetical protein
VRGDVNSNQSGRGESESLISREMKATLPDDLEILRNVRGRFPSSKSQRQGEWLLIFLLGVFFPLFWLAVFFAWWPAVLDKGHLIVLAFAFGTFIGGIHLWKTRALEYELTGDEIIERRGGRIKNQMRIADIIEIKIKISPYQLIIKTSSSKMTVQMIPSLNEAILKQATEMNAKRTDAERRQMEEDGQKRISRFKRANIIGLIVFLLLMFAIGWLAVWLKEKGILP